MTREVPAEEERSRMLFSKLRQVVTQKFGYGIEDTKLSGVLALAMKPGDVGLIVRNGASYHIKRLYRGYLAFGAETAIVKVKQGQLKGRKNTSVLGRPYYSFQGVPYAKPPVGPLRFKDPLPPEPWEGVRSALREGNISYQYDIVRGMTRGSENCLFLNIFTPELPQNEATKTGKAVLVWIHGGGFHLGSGDAEVYGPDFFMEEDVILVTLNYRLGVLGFLCTKTEDAPGNAGLKDVVQALRWIKENISVFGGDPNKVTIFGESAGAASVNMLMLSPLAKGLFSAAISQSGSAICPWGTCEDPLAAAFKLGRAFGLETKDPKVLVEYLRKIPAKVLTKKQNIAISEVYKREGIPFAFLPCVESASYPNAFLTEDPYTLLKKGLIVNDVPYITGINESEGVMTLKPIADNLPPYEVVDKDFERLVPRFLRLRYGSNQSKAVAEKIREFYFNGRPFNKKTNIEYVKLTTDTFFLYQMLKTSELQSKCSKSPIYNYYFTYDGQMALLKKLINLRDVPGPNHADDLGYLFHIPILGPKLDPKLLDMKVSKKMVRLWSNFAKYGNPTPDPEDPVLENLVWKPYKTSEPLYLNIDKEFKMEHNIHEERMKFWNDLICSCETGSLK